MNNSKELTHFVGREFTKQADRSHISSQESHEAQYNVLSRMILGAVPRLIYKGYEEGKAWRILRDRRGSICDETMYSLPMVCFCDIPENHLKIHMTKYSRFGLAFEKSFLVERGATPVLYVPKGTRAMKPLDMIIRQSEGFGLWDTSHYEQTVLRMHVIDKIGKLSHEIQDPLTPKMFEGDSSRILSKVETFTNLVASELMCYVKCFDETATEDAEDNYYMEQEWRVLDYVEFEHGDVSRVFLPDKNWASQFKADHPRFTGHVMITSLEPECVGLCCTNE